MSAQLESFRIESEPQCHPPYLCCTSGDLFPLFTTGLLGASLHVAFSHQLLRCDRSGKDKDLARRLRPHLPDDAPHDLSIVSMTYPRERME